MDKKRIAAVLAFIALVVVAVEAPGVVMRYARNPIVLALAGLGAIAYLAKRPRAKAKVLPSTTTGELPTVNLILRVAKAHRGRITAAEVLAETTLALDAVSNTLDELTLAGTCQLVVGQKGTQVYYFPEFENDSAKDELVT